MPTNRSMSPRERDACQKAVVQSPVFFVSSMKDYDVVQLLRVGEIVLVGGEGLRTAREPSVDSIGPGDLQIRESSLA